MVRGMSYKKSLRAIIVYILKLRGDSLITVRISRVGFLKRAHGPFVRGVSYKKSECYSPPVILSIAVCCIEMGATAYGRCFR